MTIPRSDAEPVSHASGPGTRHPCPVCAAPMELHQVHSSEVEVCPAHGLWLDQGELEAIISRLRQKDGFFSKSAVEEAKTSGKVQGCLLGPLSFLFD